MATLILQAPVGAGKTEAALAALIHTSQNTETIFPRIWTLLATGRQEVAFRQRLADYSDGNRVRINVEFFNFYQLNTRLLDQARLPARRISDAASLGLLRAILADLWSEDRLHLFGPIASLPGFARVVADLIIELKRAQVLPLTYAGAAQVPKDHDLALIYERYQAALRTYGLVDKEGEGWLALDALRSQPKLASSVDLLLVDGYDQFTPIQADMVAALSQRVGQVIVTLTTVPDRESLIGRRFGRALARLQDAHARADMPIELQMLDTVIDDRPADLRTLVHSIGRRDEPQDLIREDALRLIEAPQPAQEVAAVLRSVKARLLAGTRPEEILITLRDWPSYQPFFELFRRRYDLPLLLHYHQPLLENPAVDTLMKLLRISDGPFDEEEHGQGFRRADLLDLLRSPYIQADGLNELVIDRLDHISRARQVIAGRQSWLDALDPNAAIVAADEDGRRENIFEKLGLSDEQVAEISLSLETFFNHVTPSPAMTLGEYVDWVERLIGPDTLEDPDDRINNDEDIDPQDYQDGASETVKGPYTLNIARSVRREAHMDHLQQRDVAALAQFKNLLQGFVITATLLETTFDRSPPLWNWEHFLAELDAALRYAPAERGNPVRSGMVLVTTAADARGLPHEHVYILGLAEGVFPARLSEDPLYLDSERLYLQSEDVYLPTVEEQADDDGLFFELISLARRSLTLSRPTVRDGKPWNPSHLWRMVCEVFTRLPVQTLRAGQQVPPAEVASAEEALIAAASETTVETVVLQSWLKDHPELGLVWERVQAGQSIEQNRLSRHQPHNEHTGLLGDSELIQAISHELGPQRMWSASQFNDYAVCGYRFFAGRLLRLEKLQEPDDELDALMIGSLNHEILENCYARIMYENIPIMPEHQDDAIEMLEAAAKEVFRYAPEKLSFPETPRWEQKQVRLLHRLRRLVVKDFSADSPLAGHGERYVYRVEESFGFDQRNPVAIYLEQSGPARIRGYIDRIDRIGNDLWVIDYKSGSTAIKGDVLEKGLQFQMLVYIRALEGLLQQSGDNHLRVAGGFFWHLGGDRQPAGGKVDPENRDEQLASAEEKLDGYLIDARAGNFSVSPRNPENNGACSSYCDFTELCRVQVTHRRKSQKARN